MFAEAIGPADFVPPVSRFVALGSRGDAFAVETTDAVVR